MDEMHAIVKDLIETLQQQAKALEQLALRVEQQTDLRDSTQQELAVVHSELSELHRRAEKLGQEGPG